MQQMIGSRDDIHNVPYEMLAKHNKVGNSTLGMVGNPAMKEGSEERQMSFDRQGVSAAETGIKMPIYWQNSRPGVS